MALQREYLKTHPWITFELDLKRVSHTYWIILGECQSKIEHLAGVPLRPATAKKMNNLYLAKGVRATTAIEGNTLSEAQVLDFLNNRLELPPSQQYLEQEIKNIADACKQILDSALQNTGAECTVEKIKLFNKRVLHGLKVGDHVEPGAFSHANVAVGRYRAAPRRDTEFLVEELCNWLNGNFAPQGELQTGMAVIKAILAHLYLAWIHPFGDGNGRTARLLELDILLHAGVPAPAAHLLSNHYNLTRDEYYRQLEYASKSGGDVSRFLLYAVEGLRDGLREQIRYVRSEQRDVAWRNYVHEIFRDRNSTAEIRQRHLVLDLSIGEKALSRAALLELSPRVAKAYATSGDKALTRDLHALKSLGLARSTKHQLRKKWVNVWSANKSIIDAFLPKRKTSKGLDLSETSEAATEGSEGWTTVDS